MKFAVPQPGCFSVALFNASYSRPFWQATQLKWSTALHWIVQFDAVSTKFSLTVDIKYWYNWFTIALPQMPTNQNVQNHLSGYGYQAMNNLSAWYATIFCIKQPNSINILCISAV